MIPNKKHQIFADEYILTSDAIASYQKAYPNASNESARVRGHKLLQKVTLGAYVKGKQLEIQSARQNSLIETVKAKDSTNILTREKVVEMASNVVKITYNNFVKTKDKQDADSFNKSVAVYAKLEGLDSATKVEHTGGLSLDTFLIHGKKFAGENTE